MILLQRTKFLPAIFLALLVECGCGSGYQPHSVGQPQPAHFAYVLYSNPKGNSSWSKVRVFDDSVVQTESAGIASVSEVISGDNASELFIANAGDDSVTEYSLVTTPNAVKINLPAGAHPVALASTGSSRVFSLNSGTIAGCSNNRGSVSAIDTASLAVVSTTCVGPAPDSYLSAITQLPNGGKLYVINSGYIPGVFALDPTGSTVVAYIGSDDLSPWFPVAVTSSLDGSYVFVLDPTRLGPGRPHYGGVWIVTTSNDKLASLVGSGGYPNFSVLDTHLNRLYVTDNTSSTVSVFDASKVNVANDPPMPTLATVNVGSGPVGVAALPDGTKFYVANGWSNDVTVVDASSFEVLTTVALGQPPLFIQSEPTSSKIYVATQTGVIIIATSDDTISATIESPPQDPTCTSGCALQQPAMIITQ
jgi:YVTN family beta-propeller protein